MVKNILKMGAFASIALIALSGFMALIMEEILMMWFVIFFTFPILAIIGGFSLIHIKMKSKNGVYYGAPSIVDKYHLISY